MGQPTVGTPITVNVADEPFDRWISAIDQIAAGRRNVVMFLFFDNDFDRFLPVVEDLEQCRRDLIETRRVIFDQGIIGAEAQVKSLGRTLDRLMDGDGPTNAQAMRKAAFAYVNIDPSMAFGHTIDDVRFVAVIRETEFVRFVACDTREEFAEDLVEAQEIASGKRRPNVH